MSLNEKSDEVSSSSDLNGLEKLVSSLDDAADISNLYSTDDVGDGKPKRKQQNNFQLTEQNVNLTFMNISNQNAAYKSSFQTLSKISQPVYPVEGLPLHCLTTADLNAPGAKEEEIDNDSFAPGISESVGPSESIGIKNNSTSLNCQDSTKKITSGSFEPVVQSQIIVSKTGSTNLKYQYDAKKFTSTLPRQNETQNVKYFSDVSNEECIATPDVRDEDAILNPCAAKSFEDICQENFLHSSNIPVPKDSSGHFGFIYGQNCAERPNQNSARVVYEASKKRENQFTNLYEPFLSENNVHHAAGPTSMSADAQKHPQDKRFICPYCGKGFKYKYYLGIHNRYRKKLSTDGALCLR